MGPSTISSVSDPPIHPAALPAEALLASCEVRRSRASGPGGQHRNKVETATELVHRPTGVAGFASERRSQAENQREALFRLRVNLALGVRMPYVLGEPPSGLWRSRCHGRRISVNPQHADFPALLAEALDVVATLQFDVARAAMVLACTGSQLVRFLKDEPRALAMVNQGRAGAGLRRLK
jgi:hypothetical protein